MLWSIIAGGSVIVSLYLIIAGIQSNRGACKQIAQILHDSDCQRATAALHQLMASVNMREPYEPFTPEYGRWVIAQIRTMNRGRIIVGFVFLVISWFALRRG